jgi:hypothetical protein
MKRANVMAVCALLAGLAGCASGGAGPVASLTQDSAASLLVSGCTTKADVRQALGEALVSNFPSGQEVWFYQETESAARLVSYVPLVGRMTATGTRITELKILFGADGRVRKFKLQEIHVQ